MAHKVIGPDFFARPVLQVAPDLLGKVLVRKWRGREIASVITEVEAYDGPHDKACHAHKGKTARTEVMFGPAGHFYIYLVYGMYWMLNIVTGEEGYPAAVLVRGTAACSGPGRLTKHFHIHHRFNTLPNERKSGLWIEEREIEIDVSHIIHTPRISIDYAEEWREKPYRFVLDPAHSILAEKLVASALQT